MAALFVLAVVGIGAASDALSGRIPNWLTLTGIAGGVTMQTLSHGPSGLADGLAGCAIGIALLIGFYARGGMGGGDVKLLGAVGSCLGPSGVAHAMLVIALLGGIYALGVRCRREGTRHMLCRVSAGGLAGALAGWPSASARSPRHEPTLRYGIVIALGTAVTVWRQGTLPPLV